MGAESRTRPAAAMSGPMISRALMIAAPVLAAAALAACEEGVQAPRDPGVCWHAVTKEGVTRFNKVSVNQPNLEHCAAALERMRRKFNALGGRSDVVGAYQGRFIFLDRVGIKTGKSLTGNRYMALVRTADGRLVTPGAQGAPRAQ